MGDAAIAAVVQGARGGGFAQQKFPAESVAELTVSVGQVPAAVSGVASIPVPTIVAPL
jgi:hypothetical protein